MYFLFAVINVEIVYLTVRTDDKLCLIAAYGNGSLNVLYAADVQLQYCFITTFRAAESNFIMLLLAVINGNAALAAFKRDICCQLHVEVTLAYADKCGRINIIKSDVRSVEHCL